MVKVDWYERINKSQLASQFDLVGVSTTKLELKCKSCGEVFIRDKGIYHRVDDACACPNCRKNQFGFEGSNVTEPDFVIPMIEMYQSGINQKEIVDSLGISFCQCKYWLKKKGLYDPSRRQRTHNLNACQKRNEQLRQEAEAQMSLDLLAQGFIYVSGYKNKESECVIYHTACGRSFERIPMYFRGKCPLCKQDEIDAKRQLERMKSDEWKRKTEEQREAKQKEAELKEYHRLYDAHICAWCNRIFTIKEYEEREGKSNVNTLTHCSSACIEAHSKAKRKQYNNDTHGKHRLRANKYGVGFERGISLQALVNRDGLNCALCGKPCNWNDIKQGYCGPTYPSIDHIIPMAKGGAHEWSNVQVAHRSCNSLKGVKIA